MLEYLGLVHRRGGYVAIASLGGLVFRKNVGATPHLLASIYGRRPLKMAAAILAWSVHLSMHTRVSCSSVFLLGSDLFKLLLRFEIRHFLQVMTCRRVVLADGMVPCSAHVTSQLGNFEALAVWQHVNVFTFGDGRAQLQVLLRVCTLIVR